MENARNVLLCCVTSINIFTGVVDFLTMGQVAMDHTDFKGLGYKKFLDKMCAGSKTHSNLYMHNFRLRSAYENDIMPFTNYSYDFKGVIDYIFQKIINTIAV